MGYLCPMLREIHFPSPLYEIPANPHYYVRSSTRNGVLSRAQIIPLLIFGLAGGDTTPQLFSHKRSTRLSYFLWEEYLVSETPVLLVRICQFRWKILRVGYMQRHVRGEIGNSLPGRKHISYPAAYETGLPHRQRTAPNNMPGQDIITSIS